MPDWPFHAVTGKMSQRQKSKKKRKISSTHFYSVRKLWTCLKTLAAFFSKIPVVFFFLPNFALCLQFDERKQKATWDTEFQAMIMILSREREVMLRQGTFYCWSGQRGLSGVIYVKAKKRTKKSENRKKDWNFEGSIAIQAETPEAMYLPAMLCAKPNKYMYWFPGSECSTKKCRSA